jgi:hypothetical protein
MCLFVHNHEALIDPPEVARDSRGEHGRVDEVGHHDVDEQEDIGEHTQSILRQVQRNRRLDFIAVRVKAEKSTGISIFQWKRFMTWL